jgi:hypothetical protein
MADTEKADLIMESITVTLKKKDKQGIKKVLINEMFATCKGGHVTALMGPSGVGDALFKPKAHFFAHTPHFHTCQALVCCRAACNAGIEGPMQRSFKSHWRCMLTLLERASEICRPVKPRS